MIRARLKITGKVQGVFFRAQSFKKARQIGDIKGYVANESDGSVTVLAEGPENKMRDFLAWCHTGPSTAKVEKVEIEMQDYTDEFDDYSIRY